MHVASAGVPSSFGRHPSLGAGGGWSAGASCDDAHADAKSATTSFLIPHEASAERSGLATAAAGFSGAFRAMRADRASACAARRQSMRSTLGIVTIGALVVACGSSSSTTPADPSPDPGESPPPAEQPPTGDYPKGPYGMGVGHVFPNVSLSGYVGASGS